VLQLASTDTLSYEVTQPAESTTKDAAPLVATGTNVSGLVPIGVLALATGAVLVAARRKRSQS
jgi:LPXTG-motif cell wall-anchored protein